MKNIIIYWMRWSWKSTIWKLLSEKLNKTFVDLDKYIESKLNLKLRKYIQDNSWEDFRKLENEYLNEIFENNSNFILSLWWWTITFEENRKILKTEKNILVYLYSDINEIISRICEDEANWNNRTSLTWKNVLDEITNIYNQRKEIYEENFHIKITNNDLDETINNLIINLKEYE